MATTHTFKVEGMHCRSCKILIEEELAEVPGVTAATVDESTHIAVVTMETDESSEALARTFTESVQAMGYGIAVL